MFPYLGLDTVVTAAYDSRAMQTAAAGVRVPYDIYRRLVEIAEKRDCTMGQALDFYIREVAQEAVRQVREEYEAKLKALQEEYEAKLKKVEEEYENELDRFCNFPLGKCSVCGEPLIWDLTDEYNLGLLEKAVNKAQFFHGKCKK